jgi:hypothetical protein
MEAGDRFFPEFPALFLLSVDVDHCEGECAVVINLND